MVCETCGKGVCGGVGICDKCVRDACSCYS